MSLAGELGIEIPSEPPASATSRDPVADLLGFPPSSARTPYGQNERRADEEQKQQKRYRDDDNSPRDRWTTDDADEGMTRDIEESSEIVRFEAVRDGDEPPKLEPDGERRPPQRRRRRRGGRGRREGGERIAEGRGASSREGDRPFRRNDRASVRTNQDAPQGPRDEFDDDAATDSDKIETSPTDQVADGQRRTDEDEPQQKRRRRRGRRGRGGSRERGDTRSEGRLAPKKNTADSRASTETGAMSEEIDFVELIDDDRTPLEPAGFAADMEHNDDEELSTGGDSHGVKNSVRDIMTWKEAIGMIIEGNMEARARSPQSAHSSHGSSRGRGRGRGRGGHRGG
jgi:hypothetical protein